MKKANEVLCLDTDDDVMAVLRYFDWNQEKMEAKWYDEKNQQKLRYEIGLEFNPALVQKYPFIEDSLAKKNGGLCAVMYCDFENPDEGGDPDMEAVSLSCGHQYSALAWNGHLKERVKSDGPACVFSKCP